MRSILRAVFTILALACLLPFPSHSQQMQCNKRESVKRQLEQKYNERVISAGVTSNGALLEVYASPNGQTFSIVITDPNSKMSCLMATGTDWISIDHAKRGDPI